MSVLAELPAAPIAVAQQINGKRIRVPPRVSLGEITVNNVGTLRKLNMVLFPVAYSDKFYKDVLNLEGEDYCKLVFYQDLAVGSIVCRLEPASAPAPIDISTSISPPVLPVASSSSSTTVAVQRNHHEPHKLYIMTLGVLAPYRRQGLASKLVRHIIEMAEASHRPPVAQVYKIKLSEKDKEAQKKATRSATTAAASGTVESKPLVTALYLHVQLGNDEAKAFWEGHGFRVTGTVENYYRKIEPRAAWILEREIAETSYNGVGLSTARGSGTNGHITKNRSTIRHRENFDKPADFKDSSTRAPDAGILEHERKRRVEVKCLELQVSLEDDGVEESIIEEKVSELRKGLLSASAAAAGTERERGSIKVHETHELGQAKEVANERMRKAMGINSSNHVEGKAFDREAQALDKVKRQEDRQRNEMERKERAVEMDLSRERQAKERESGKAKKEEELKRSKAAAAEVSRARREAEAKQSEKERDSGINKLDAELLQGRTGRVVEPRGGDKADEDESRPVQKRSRSRSTSSSPRNRRRDSRDDYRRSSPRQRYDSRSPRRRSPSPRRRGRSPTRSISRSRSPDSRSRSRSRSYSRSRSRSPPRQRARRDSPEFRRRSPSPVGRGNERQPAGRGRSADSRDRSMSMSMSRSPER